MKQLLIGVLVLALLAACGGSGDDETVMEQRTAAISASMVATPVTTTPEPTPRPTPTLRPSPTPRPRPTSTRSTIDEVRIGKTVTYTDGFTVTINTVEDPVVAFGEAISPRASIVLTAIEVSACAGDKKAPINPFYFEVALDDNTRADITYSYAREPQLDATDIYPGECIHGWVTYERHWKPRPKYVIVDILGYTPFRVIVPPPA